MKLLARLNVVAREKGWSGGLHVFQHMDITESGLTDDQLRNLIFNLQSGHAPSLDLPQPLTFPPTVVVYSVAPTAPPAPPVAINAPPVPPQTHGGTHADKPCPAMWRSMTGLLGMVIMLFIMVYLYDLVGDGSHHDQCGALPELPSPKDAL